MMPIACLVRLSVCLFLNKTNLFVATLGTDFNAKLAEQVAEKNLKLGTRLCDLCVLL